MHSLNKPNLIFFISETTSKAMETTPTAQTTLEIVTSSIESNQSLIYLNLNFTRNDEVKQDLYVIVSSKYIVCSFPK